MEREFDGFDGFVDVGVIVFERGDDGDVGEVMKEFGAFIEESRVVFVAFDGEGGIFDSGRGRVRKAEGLTAD